ncbi:hypothetical protein V8C34DRAFT_302672 [Trichoderma compactum]
MSLLIHLTPLLILILLYRLCPAHFPPSTTTSRLFLLYTLICNLLAHRTSPWPLIQNLALLILAHVLLAAIHFLHYLAKLAQSAKDALLPVYAELAESVQLSVRNLAAHVHAAQLDELTRNRILNKDENEDNLTDDELEIDSKPEPYKPLDTVSNLFDGPTAQFLRLQEFVRLSVLYMLHFSSMCLSHVDVITSLHDQAGMTLYITRIRFALLIKRSLGPFRRIFSNLIVLGSLYAPAIAIFALHFILWAILLSIGELYVLFVCLLCIFWMLSWLS